MMGIGIGIVFTIIIMFILGTTNTKMSDSDIEKAARALGMHYEDECKSIFNNDAKSSKEE